MVQHYIIWKLVFTTLLESSKDNPHKEKLPNSQDLSTKGKEPYSLEIFIFNFFLINKREEKRERKKNPAYYLRR